MLLTRTTQPMYDAARLAKGPLEPESASVEDEDVGHITRRMGKSLVHEETRRAVDIALGVARPGRGVFWGSVSGFGWPVVDVGDVRSEDVLRVWVAAVAVA